MDYKKIKYSNKNYGIFELKYKNVGVPVIMDWNDFKQIKNINKSWYINDYGAVVTRHIINNTNSEIYLHELVLAFKSLDDYNNDINNDATNKYIKNKDGEKKPIVHINKFGIDNRRINLMYDDTDKNTNKNLKKKKRIIELPENSNIDPDEIPTYVWYIKPNGSHGDRFIVEIGSI